MSRLPGWGSTVSREDRDLFLREMQDVQRIRPSRQVVIHRETDSALAQAARREAAVAEAGEVNFLALSQVELLDSHCPLEFKRPGLQHGVFRKLKQGRYTVDARLDLHRMTVEQAREEVFGFIREAQQYDLRSLMIVHGRGSHSRSGPAILKSHVNQWLPEFEEVQAFVSAQPRDGGVGAVYVLLKKTTRARERNRIRFSRGRTLAP